MKKKTLFKVVRISALFTTLAAGLVTLEINGYNAFDRPDGRNTMCSADLSCRKLTDGEITMIRSVFGDQIDYSRVKLFNRRFMGFIGTKRCALSPNGNIYIPNNEGGINHDFSAPGRRDADRFIHETTHVWQYQHGRKIISEAFALSHKNVFNYGASYSYNIDAETGFNDLNMEQQGEVVRHYFVERQQLQDLLAADTADSGAIEQSCKALKPKENLLINILPITPEAACAATPTVKKAAKVPAPLKTSTETTIKFDFAGCFDVKPAP